MSMVPKTKLRPTGDLRYEERSSTMHNTVRASRWPSEDTSTPTLTQVSAKKKDYEILLLKNHDSVSSSHTMPGEK